MIFKAVQIIGLVAVAVIVAAAIWRYPLVFAALGALMVLRGASILKSGR